MKTLRDRVAWAITIIKDDKRIGKDITDIDLAQLLGISERTLNTYKQGGGSLKSTAVEGLIAHYEFDVMWLYHGQGEPFPGARGMGYKDVCGPEPDHPLIYHEGAASGPVPHPAAAIMPSPAYSDNGIDPALQAMHDIQYIFNSGDPILVPAIQANLNAFKRALLREQQFAQVMQENKELKERIAKLEAVCDEFRGKLNALEAENKALRAEVNRLKATYESPDEGSGPLAHSSAG